VAIMEKQRWGGRKGKRKNTMVHTKGDWRRKRVSLDSKMYN